MAQMEVALPSVEGEKVSDHRITVRARDVQTLLELVRNRPLIGESLEAYGRLTQVLQKPILGHPSQSVKCKCGKKETPQDKMGRLEATSTREAS